MGISFVSKRIALMENNEAVFDSDNHFSKILSPISQTLCCRTPLLLLNTLDRQLVKNSPYPNSAILSELQRSYSSYRTYGKVGA